MKNNIFMEIALEEAYLASQRDEVPVGACLVADGELIARAGNQMRARNNPTAHAEMIVMEQGLIASGKARLDGCDLYITLEPCAMCAGAIALNRIERLYYGARDEKMGALDFFYSPACQHRPEIYGGMGRQEAEQLMRDFFQFLRQHRK